MEQRLVAAGERRPNLLALSRSVPIGGSGDGAVVRREQKQIVRLAGRRMRRPDAWCSVSIRRKLDRVRRHLGSHFQPA